MFVGVVGSGSARQLGGYARNAFGRRGPDTVASMTKPFLASSVAVRSIAPLAMRAWIAATAEAWAAAASGASFTGSVAKAVHAAAVATAASVTRIRAFIGCFPSLKAAQDRQSRIKSR